MFCLLMFSIRLGTFPVIMSTTIFFFFLSFLFLLSDTLSIYASVLNGSPRSFFSQNLFIFYIDFY